MGTGLSAELPAKRKAPDARAIAEGALLGDLTVMLVLIALYVPYAGPALATISPIPFVLLIIRRGWRVSLEATIVACMLIGFLTGPFSAFAVVVLMVRAAALGLGLRRGWRVRNTILGGTMLMWVFVWLGVTGVALAFPSWRAATEQGLALTYHQLAGLTQLVLTLARQHALWLRLQPHSEDFLRLFLRYWLYVLPLLVWPVLLVLVTAEYVILELILPRFGITPPPFRLPWIHPPAPSGKERGSRPGSRLALLLKEQRAAVEQRRGARTSGRRETEHGAGAPPVDAAPAERRGAIEGRIGAGARPLPAEETVRD